MSEEGRRLGCEPASGAPLDIVHDALHAVVVPDQVIKGVDKISHRGDEQEDEETFPCAGIQPFVSELRGDKHNEQGDGQGDRAYVVFAAAQFVNVFDQDVLQPVFRDGHDIYGDVGYRVVDCHIVSVTYRHRRPPFRYRM